MPLMQRMVATFGLVRPVTYFRYRTAGRIILLISAMSSPSQVSSSHGDRPTLSHRLFLAVTWILKGLLRIGLPMGPMVLLTVRGRKSGQPRTTPVDLFEGSGRSYLVSTHRQESSVLCRNLTEPTILAGFDFLPHRSPAAVVAVEMWEPAFCAGFQAPGKRLPSGWELPQFPPGASFP